MSKEAVTGTMWSDSDSGLPSLIKLYLREIGEFPLLGAREEVVYAQVIERGREASRRLQDNNGFESPQRDRLIQEASEGMDARKRLTESNLRLVVNVAKKYLGRGLPLLDLIQEGNIGLAQAVERFDWRRGCRFSTYGTWWIRQAVDRAIAEKARTIRLPVHKVEEINKIRVSYWELQQETGGEPSYDQIAERTGTTAKKVQACMKVALLSDPSSLEESFASEDKDGKLEDLISDQAPGVEERVVSDINGSEIRKSLKSMLSGKEYRVLELRFGLDGKGTRSLEVVGGELGVTRERARQIEAGALKKLRDPRNSNRLRNYSDCPE